MKNVLGSAKRIAIHQRMEIHLLGYFVYTIITHIASVNGFSLSPDLLNVLKQKFLTVHIFLQYSSHVRRKIGEMSSLTDRSYP